MSISSVGPWRKITNKEVLSPHWSEVTMECGHKRMLRRNNRDDVWVKLRCSSCNNVKKEDKL